ELFARLLHFSTRSSPTNHMSSSPITPEIIAEHGLRPEEYQQILAILGREPSFTELGIFSVMWSEHCSYKNSKPLLKTLPTTGPHVLQGPGENAGVVALDDELAVCFKMESHNHPSAVEPYQGAATGVGGILRDIFTMGARPVALVDCLFFGEPGASYIDRIIRGVVHGISDYGNCVGVPTVAGQVSFFPCYDANPLVNAMAVGVMRREDLTLAKARNAGSIVVYYGNATGRDGVHGATFASVELTDDTMEQRSAVQVGDPFMGKKILEATLELIKSGTVEAIQDMGAAGLTCSGCEIAGRGRLGMELNLDRVPQRAKNMSPYEMMLSESQERMLAVIPSGNLERAMDILAKWEVNPAVVGHVTEDGFLTVWHQKMIVAKVPALKISEESPVYTREAREPANRPKAAYQPGEWANDIDVRSSLLELLKHPNIASKHWIYQQYDTQVQTNTVLGPGAGAAVLRVDRSRKLLGISTGVDPLKMACDPFIGAQMAVAEAALNLLCVGCKPLGLTDNLNFGNPEKPEQFWALKRAVEGIGEMSLALNAPVTGGNVSLYNESQNGPIWPTPTIGMVGAADSAEHIITPGFKDAGDLIYVIGELPSSLAGTLLAYIRDGRIPAPLNAEMSESFTQRMIRLQELMFKLVDAKILKCAQDVSEGGLAVALAECAICSPNAAGCDVSEFDEDKSFWFGEPGALVVVSVADADQEKMRDLLDEFEEMDFVEVGEVIAEAKMILPGGEMIGIDELRKRRETLPAFMP
ncbi:MAG: phosphoribosylformylglycinamidine synthase subunit PurL, partial [Candidatus Sumerlaeota bacterium]